MKTPLYTLFLCALLAGCSPVMAARQDDYVHVEDVQPGVGKAVVLSTFGAPLQNYVNHRGESCEIFRFRQGYRGSTKVARAMFHGVADIMTLGLWEVVGTPVEAGFNGENASYEVCYNKENIVVSVAPLSKGTGPAPARPEEEKTEEYAYR